MAPDSQILPDIFITGHIHGHYLGNYNGVRYVNSSTWQSQTEYQKMMNYSPDPCMGAGTPVFSRILGGSNMCGLEVKKNNKVRVCRLISAAAGRSSCSF